MYLLKRTKYQNLAIIHGPLLLPYQGITLMNNSNKYLSRGGKVNGRTKRDSNFPVWNWNLTFRFWIKQRYPIFFFGKDYIKTQSLFCLNAVFFSVDIFFSALTYSLSSVEVYFFPTYFFPQIIDHFSKYSFLRKNVQQLNCSALKKPKYPKISLSPTLKTNKKLYNGT